MQLGRMQSKGYTSPPSLGCILPPLRFPMSKTRAAMPLLEDDSETLEILEFLNSWDGKINLTECGEEALKLQLGDLHGVIKLNPQQRQSVSQIFKKLVPEAPRQISLDVSIKPEQYLAKALENNIPAFEQMKAESVDYAVIADEKTEALALFEAGVLDKADEEFGGGPNDDS